MSGRTGSLSFFEVLIDLLELLHRNRTRSLPGLLKPGTSGIFGIYRDYREVNVE